MPGIKIPCSLPLKDQTLPFIREEGILSPDYLPQNFLMCPYGG